MHNQLIYDVAINKFMMKDSLPEEVWLGVYPRNRLPYHALCNLPKSNLCKMLVLNLDNEDEPGSHFIAIARIKSVLYLYDSFGSELHYRLLEPGLSLLLERYKLKLWKNTVQHQSFLSNTCGYFCVWFLLELYENRSTVTPSNISRVFLDQLKQTTSRVNEMKALKSITNVIEQQEYQRMVRRIRLLLPDKKLEKSKKARK